MTINPGSMFCDIFKRFGTNHDFRNGMKASKNGYLCLPNTWPVSIYTEEFGLTRMCVLLYTVKVNDSLYATRLALEDLD